jgi:type II secretory pathway pseudopilin PulG
VTLVEIIVAMTLTLAVFAITLPFVKVQTRALGENASRADAEQVARYAQRQIDKELRLAVADPGQPLLVYAGPLGIAFNVNLLAKDTTDPSAVEIDGGADSSETEGWRLADAAALPISGRDYPETEYYDVGGALTRNETVMYFLHPDTVTGRDDIYVLYRRVNARDSVQIVRGIHVPEDSAFFSYQTMVSGSLTTLASSALPLEWDSTAIDDIRAVQLRSAGFFRNRQANEDVIRTVYWSVLLSNRTESGRDCGAAPSAPANGDFSLVDNSKPLRVELEWDDSPDDASGDGDVVYYVVERKRTTASVWTTLASVPATRSTTYLWSHMNPSDTGSFDYGVRAVDCGGATSTRATDAAITFP